VSSGTLPEGQVRAMFDRIAGVYDTMNSVMTAGMHHRWRRRAIDLARVGPDSKVLDVATGTGDLAIEAAARGAQVVGSDFSEGMLALARKKADQPRAGSRAAALPAGASITFEQADALALPYPDNTFDAATVGFGARNFSDLQQGLREMTRVVRPGGRVVVLEITTPTHPPLSTFFSLWFDRVVPLVGRVAGDPDAYSYLPNSVKRFPGPEPLAATMERAGLGELRWILTAGGIIAIHAGVKGSVESSP
jgi:demethylmenaquinone methyltransferase/2-methoxy-6-polyprenyl-1,4-benzoquinol methylase